MSITEHVQDNHESYTIVAEPGKKVFGPETMSRLSRALGQATLLRDNATFAYTLSNGSKLHIYSGDIDPRIKEEARILDCGASINFYGHLGSSLLCANLSGTIATVEVHLKGEGSYVNFATERDEGICSLLINRNGEAVWHLENRSRPRG